MFSRKGITRLNLLITLGIIYLFIALILSVPMAIKTFTVWFPHVPEDYNSTQQERYMPAMPTP